MVPEPAGRPLDGCERVGGAQPGVVVRMDADFGVRQRLDD